MHRALPQPPASDVIGDAQGDAGPACLGSSLVELGADLLESVVHPFGGTVFLHHVEDHEPRTRLSGNAHKGDDLAKVCLLDRAEKTEPLRLCPGDATQ